MRMKNGVRNIIVVVLFFLTFWFGIRPIITGDEFENRIKKMKGAAGRDEYALVVFGTEPEGIAAALAGARMGLKTLLVTEDIDPGSYIKSGLITYTTPDYATINGEKIKLNTGIYTELFGDTGGNFSVEDYIHTVIQKLERESNLDIFYNAGILSAQTDGNTVESASVYYNGGKRQIKASFFIDATEDGKFLEVCNVPYYTGSGDIGVPNAYMPVHYNFIISNVKWEDIESIRKQIQNVNDFRQVLEQYERVSKKTKIPNLSFVRQPDDNMLISGIKMRQVNVDDPSAMEADLKDALAEAKTLTAFLQYTFVPFENSSFVAGASSFYIPEYRHFSGRYRLTVEDVLENRNFRTKIVLASAPIDGEKFVSPEFSEEYSYIIGSPKVYSIPLECFIAQNYDNLMMVGKKASFSSLASTSAGRMPVSITSGNALGITAAYCYLNSLTPVELAGSSDEILQEYQKLLKRAGITLVDFDEPNPNKDHWAWPSVKVLVEYGLIAGGIENDYLFDFEASQENLAILVINMIVKVLPDMYSLDLDARVRAYAVDEKLTGEKACEIILKTLDIPYEQGNAFAKVEKEGIISKDILERITPDKAVTLDCVYALTVDLINRLK
ncbi:MAG: FAD-dependent oxidoreductase [Clostridiaceae bacterium]|nr:FAD-dependent oxidoreductase [Clostridiaceae bacterium]